MLEIGTIAPDFTLPDQNGEMHSLSDYRGQKVILYFYPKDMTAGCTKQACVFGELYPQFREKEAVILGVSKDTIVSHKKFEEKYGLPFTILSDTEKKAIQAYDVWKEKKMYGKTTMGVIRSTYLIDENGVIEKAFGKLSDIVFPCNSGAPLRINIVQFSVMCMNGVIFCLAVGFLLSVTKFSFFNSLHQKFIFLIEIQNFIGGTIFVFI